MQRLFVIISSVLASASLAAQSPAAADSFSYANGDLSVVGVAGVGWDAAEGGWQVGDSTAGRRFVITGNECFYNGDGTTQLPTWQPRTLAAEVALHEVVRRVRQVLRLVAHILLERQLDVVRQRELDGPVIRAQRLTRRPLCAR